MNKIINFFKKNRHNTPYWCAFIIVPVLLWIALYFLFTWYISFIIVLSLIILSVLFVHKKLNGG